MAAAAAAAARAARPASRTPASAATRFVQRRLRSSGGTVLSEEKNTAENVDIINRAITWAKSSGGKKVVSSLLFTLGTTSLVHWAVSSVTAHAKNEADEKVIQQDESNKTYQIEIEKEPLQLEGKLESSLDDKKMAT